MMKKTVQGLMVLTALLWSTGGVEARDLLQNAKFDVYGLVGGSTIIDAQYFDSADSFTIRALNQAPNSAWVLPCLTISSSALSRGSRTDLMISS